MKHLSPSLYQTDKDRWRALQKRDRRADGHFFYSVATTGIYCRPACPSRLAARRNVTFHNSCTEAERAGFRPCKRCDPRGPSPEQKHGEAVMKACRLIEATEALPSLETLAAEAGFSRFHFLRIFKAIVGITPRAYSTAHRTERIRAELPRSRSVTEAIYSAGYGSSSRFYEGASQTLGMLPKDFQRKGEKQRIRFSIHESSLGLVLIAGTTRGICSVRFGSDARGLEQELRTEFNKAEIQSADAPFKRWVRSVLGQIENPTLSVDLPFDIRGTAFQHKVWQALRTIPPGQTVSYTELAARIASPSAIRAVASACAANPVAVLVPCHRVVRKTNHLAGYRWGLERKQRLLEKEKQRSHP